MKRILLSLVLISSLSCSLSYARRGGGSSFAGGMAGGMVGSMVGSAITKDGSGKRAERETRLTQEKVDQMRYEMQEHRGSFTINLMIFAFFIMFLLILGMFFMILKMKKKKGML